MQNEIHYEIGANNQTAYPLILTLINNFSRCTYRGFICDLRNFPFRICGSTVVKLFQTSFNFEPMKTKPYHTIKMTGHLIYNLSH